MTAAPQITHRDDCTSPSNTRRVRGKSGDLLLRCRSCNRFVVLADGTPPYAASTPDVPELPAPPAPRSRYVCREHGTPVSWRGTGCRRCAAEQARDRREGADR